MTPAHDTIDGPEASEGRAVDPALLALIQRVAHREHLLDPTASVVGSRTPVAAALPGRRTDSMTRPGRRRPATESSARRTTRGTTARKVTWSR